MWPSTPLTSYVAGTAPAIKASDLNAFQSGINGLINGTYSLAGGVIDGTGGAVVVPTANALRVGSGQVATLDGGKLAFTGISNPSAGTSLANQVRPITQAKAWGMLTTDGAGNVSLVDGAHVFSVTIAGGHIVVTFASAFASGNYAVIANMIADDTLPRSVGAKLFATTNVSLFGEEITLPDGPRSAYDFGARVAAVWFVAFGRQS